LDSEQAIAKDSSTTIKIDNERKYLHPKLPYKNSYGRQGKREYGIGSAMIIIRLGYIDGITLLDQFDL